MASTLLEKAKALRGEAWAEVVSSRPFQAFQAADELVVKLGGESIIPVTAERGVSDTASVRAQTNGSLASKRVTQTEAAAAAIRKAGVPMQLGPLLGAAVALGAEVKGANLVANFRSSLSKDSRFQSVMRHGKYYWWFADEALPPGWNETADPDLLSESAASGSSSKEGGDANAATTLTH